MIETLWPSSRRLAISPPHDSATSSAWGAMKTWVIGSEDRTSGVGRGGAAARYGASGRPAALADERHEHDRSVGPLPPFRRGLAFDDDQLLDVARPDRDDEASAHCELLPQRVRDGGGRGGHDDPVPRRAVGIAGARVTRDDL